MEQEFRAVNIVMATHLSSVLDLRSIYTLLTTVAVDFTLQSKKDGGSRQKVPYFGMERVILSVRFGNQSRGIRKEGGQLRNVVSVDLQYAQKNIHLKISRTKIQLTGALTEEMGVGAFRTVLDHLVMVNEHFLHIRCLPVQVQLATIQWIIQHLRDGDGRVKCHDHPDVIREFDILNRTSSPLGFSPSSRENPSGEREEEKGVDYRMARYLAMFTHEHTLFDSYYQWIRQLLELEVPIYTQAPRIELVRVANAIYNYQCIPRGSRVLRLIDLAKALHNLGYGVSYHNWASSRSVRIMVPLNTPQEEKAELDAESPTPSSEDDSGSDGSMEKISAHRFSVYRSGSVRQCSPCSIKEAREEHLRLLESISLIVSQGLA